MQSDLGIGVLGHRETLLSGIRGLWASPQADREESWHHQAAPDSPESPILKAELHRQKLLRKLEKAQAHSAALHRSVTHCSRDFPRDQGCSARNAKRCGCFFALLSSIQLQSCLTKSS